MFGTGVLSSGSTEPAVTELQRWLIDRGFLLAPTPSGTFDDATVHAVKAFQFSATIGVDGRVGDGTRAAAAGWTTTAEAGGWHPAAVRNVQRDSSAGAFRTASRRGVLHTTEGTRLPSYTSPPHFTIGRNGSGQPVAIWQHYPTTTAAMALRGGGAVETNRHGAIQIEIVASAANTPSLATDDPELFAALGDLLSWIESHAGVAHAIGAPFVATPDEGYGLQAPSRLSDTEWEATTGWVGHQHVPHNTHWDPGGLDVRALLDRSAATVPAAPALGTPRHRPLSPPSPPRRPVIRATTRQLTNAFPSLTFTIETAGLGWFEVILTRDRSLFAPEAASRRTAQNFHASREDGLRAADAGQARWVAPVPVLQAFAEAAPQGGPIYYTVVAYADEQGSGALPAADPGALAHSAPAVQMVPGFVGHTAAEPMGVPLSMLRPAARELRRQQQRYGGTGTMTRSLGESGSPVPPTSAPPPPPPPAPVDPGVDRSEGEDGYDHRLASAPGVPDYPPRMDTEEPAPTELAPTAVAPTPEAPPSEPPPRVDPAPPAEPRPPTPEAAARYDDGWGDWDAVALDSTFGPEQPRPRPLRGEETVPPDDEELESLEGWEGSTYVEQPGGAPPSPDSPPVDPAPHRRNGGPDGAAPQLHAAPIIALSPEQKRDLIEAWIGPDRELYSAVNADGEFNGAAGTDHPAYQRYHRGLSFGIVGFPQDDGHLGQLLTLMRSRDADRFAAVFGPAADELVAVTNRPSPRSSETETGRSERVQPVEGHDLWEEPWTTRFRAAGAEPAFQGAQIELASALYLDPVLRFASDLGLATPRGLALVFDRAAHRGVDGGRTWVIETVGPLQTAALVNAALRGLGVPDVEAFQQAQPHLLVDDQFGPLTHAAMTAALRALEARTGQSPVPLPTYRQMLDALAQRAAGQLWGDRMVRIARDPELADEFPASA